MLGKWIRTSLQVEKVNAIDPIELVKIGLPGQNVEDPNNLVFFHLEEIGKDFVEIRAYDGVLRDRAKAMSISSRPLPRILKLMKKNVKPGGKYGLRTANLFESRRIRIVPLSLAFVDPMKDVRPLSLFTEHTMPRGTGPVKLKGNPPSLVN
jgi:hypothetical protein